jgi:peptidoglycan/LPS O-acetylase OafA/YrhL
VDDEGLTRPLLVLAAGAAMLLWGAFGRWQAPLVVGSVAVAVVALSQLAPYAVGAPRWLSLGAVGLLLLVVGARYEQRRQNAAASARWVRALR